VRFDFRTSSFVRLVAARVTELRAMSESKTLPSTEKVKEEVKEATKEAASDFVQSLRALVAGGVGGVCAVVTGHPFDLVKVRLQTAEKGVYSGAMDVVRKIMAQRGPLVCTTSRTESLV